MTTKVVALFSLCVVVLAAGPSAAQAVQPCRTGRVRHAKVTSQGRDAKYAVKYQSGSGEDCRIYRLRNLGGHPATHVLWKAGDETLLDVELPACPADKNCPGVTAEMAGQEVQRGSSSLRYGEKGEYSDTPDTFVEKHSVPRQHPEYQTLLLGTIADSPSKLTEVAVQVSSSVEGTGPYRLTYRLSLVQGRSLPEKHNRQAVELAQQVSIWPTAAKKEDPTDLSVEWQGITPEIVHPQPAEKKATLALSQSSPETRVSINAKGMKLSRPPLIIRSGRRKIAVTTAPAYLPVNSDKR